MIVKYIALDGKEFDNQKDCEEHEHAFFHEGGGIYFYNIDGNFLGNTWQSEKDFLWFMKIAHYIYIPEDYPMETYRFFCRWIRNCGLDFMFPHSPGFWVWNGDNDAWLDAAQPHIDWLNRHDKVSNDLANRIDS